MTVIEFMKKFSDDDVCLEHLMETRFGVEHECGKCGKRNKFSRVKARPVYQCSWCAHQISPCAGTPMHRTRTPLTSWFYAMFLFTTTRHGVPAKELQRQLGVTYKTAWRMGHEIRKYMAELDGDAPLGGSGSDVEVDETYVGGKREGKRGRGADGKTVVFGMLERDGRVMTKVVPDAKTHSIRPHITENVEEGTTVHSDEWWAYRGLNGDGYAHETVNHGAKEWARGNTHVNTLESYWSQIKRSIKGTHIAVSGKHMSKYLGEFEFCYNLRKTPEQMLPRILSFQPCGLKHS